MYTNLLGRRARFTPSSAYDKDETIEGIIVAIRWKDADIEFAVESKSGAIFLRNTTLSDVDMLDNTK